MNKIVRTSGLQVILDWAHPFLKSIVDGKVQLANGFKLDIPDQSDLGFAATSDPDIIRWTFNGVSGEIDRRAFFGLIPIHGTEPVTFADVGPKSVQTQISMFRLTAVDDGGGS